MSSIDWNSIHSIHFVGIKGVAMTALALWASDKGFIVTGSDTAEVFPTDILLKQKKISVQIGFSSDHVAGDLIIYTGAHGGRENPEVIAAKEKGIPVFPHGEALGEAMKDKRRVSVAGCHGKTTTTAMITTIAASAGINPSFAIGSGEIRGLGSPGHAGSGEWFIAEADEYVTEPHFDLTPRFLWQHPEIAVITTIDFDHPDVYADIQAVKRAYADFVHSMVGEKIIILNEDDTNSDEIKKITLGKYHSFGLGTTAEYRIIRDTIMPDENKFYLQSKSEKIGPFIIRVPGLQNVANAAAAAVAAHFMGLPWSAIRSGLAQFYGAKRRFEALGTYHGARCFDDYAHHPAEIQATIRAAREWYRTERLVVIFQPHTFSRTLSLLKEFGEAFSGADLVHILPIYASARETQGSIDAQTLVKEIKKHQSAVVSMDSIQQLATEVKSGDVVLFMGAGDIGRKAMEFINN